MTSIFSSYGSHKHVEFIPVCIVIHPELNSCSAFYMTEVVVMLCHDCGFALKFDSPLVPLYERGVKEVPGSDYQRSQDR